MNIRKLLNKFIKKNNSNVIVSLKDLIGIPKREDFTNPRDIEAIDKYKHNYLKELKDVKTIVSIDLIPQELHDFQNIYLELLTNLCLKSETDVSFELVNEALLGTEALDIEITKLKLVLYINEVEELEKEVKLRLVALTEILNENLLFKRKRVTIENEINNLLFLRSTLITQKRAMEVESINYLNELRNLDITEFCNSEEEQEVITKRLNDLKELIKVAKPELLEKAEALNLNDKNLIAYLEEQLELYVYTHKSLLSVLKSKLETLECELRKNTAIKKLKNKYLEYVKRIETFYKIFSKFGRNIIHKKDLEQLYKIKFTLLTLDILENDSDVFAKVSFTESEFYQDIIFKRIEKLIKEKNSDIDFITKTNNKTYKEVLDLVIKIIKEDKKEFSPWDTLNNRLILAFILSFDKPRNFIKFFLEYKYSKPKTERGVFDCFEGIFKWSDSFPLTTYFQILDYNKIAYSSRNFKVDDPLYEFYQLVKKEIYPDNSVYELPTGLVEIHVSNLVNYDSDISVLHHIENIATSKTLIFPSTLRKLKGPAFSIQEIKDIRLNEGLEEIENEALSCQIKSNYLTIPSSLRKIGINSINFKGLKRIALEGYEHSLILEEIINRIVNSCFDWKKLENQRWQSVMWPHDITLKPNYTEITAKTIYTYDNESTNPTDKVFDIYEISPTFEELSFSGKKSYSFFKKDLTFYVEINIFYSKVFQDGKLKEEMFEKIVKPAVLSKIWEQLGLLEQFSSQSRVLKKNNLLD